MATFATQSISGLASGLDTASIISALMQIDKQPQVRIQQKIVVEQARQQAPDLMAVAGVQVFAAAVGKNRDRVGRDELRLFDKRRGDPLAQILLKLAGALVTERGIVAIRRRVQGDTDMFTEASR